MPSYCHGTDKGVRRSGAGGDDLAEHATPVGAVGRLSSVEVRGGARAVPRSSDDGRAGADDGVSDGGGGGRSESGTLCGVVAAGSIGAGAAGRSMVVERRS
jgi:hypothetical protein